MKKIIGLFLSAAAAATLSLGLCACAGDSNGNGNGGGNEPPIDTTPTYTVTWRDETGALLTTTTVKEGDVPGYTYDKADTAEWDYTVIGWSATQGGEVIQSLPQVKGDVTYYASVDKVKQKYTVTFDANGGEYEKGNVTLEYGETLDEPEEKPVLDGKRFVGWCTDGDCKTAAQFPITVKGNVTFYAKYVDVVNVKELLKKLTGGYKLDPYSYIPAKMRPASANLANADGVKTQESDYADFVGMSQMPHNGYGEQWHMITDNLKQSELFFNALSGVDTIVAAAVATFNNYIDGNPDDTAHHSFKNGIYNVTVDCGANDIYCVLDYTATFPLVGEQTAQISLCMNIKDETRTVRIQLGDANALAYTFDADSYKFAIKYGGVRRALFEVKRDMSGAVVGHINEFLTASGVTDKAISSAADFYVNGNYVTAVGNKADGMLAFDGYICELYDSTSGEMIAYEVRETKTVLGKTVEFNTLWFDLADVGGINSVKYDQSEEKFYVNGNSAAFENKEVGGLSVKRYSRRYDIEFRTQYYYVQNGDDTQEVKVKVPMLFVQEENYDTLSDDISEKNGGLAVSVGVSATRLNKLKTDYASLVDVFIARKDNVDIDTILDFIGQKTEFN